MGRNTFIIILGLALAGILYWNSLLRKENSRQSDLIESQASRISELENQLNHEEQRDQSGVQSEKDAIARLTQLIQAKQSQIDGLDQSILEAKNLNNDANNIGALQFDIKHQQEVVNDLGRQIQMLEAQKKDLNSKSHADQSEAQSTQKENDVQLAANVRAQRAALNDLNQRLAQVKKTARLNPNASETIDQLETQIKNQKILIDQLVSERQSTNAQWSSKKTQIQAESQRNLGDLNYAEDQLKDRLNSEKNNLNQMRKRLQDTRNSNSGHTQNIQKLQANEAQLRSELADLRRELQDHQKRLSELTGP